MVKPPLRCHLLIGPSASGKSTLAAVLAELRDEIRQLAESGITEAELERAKAKADEMGELRNSIRRGKGNLCGFLGEEVVLAAWEGSTSHNTFQHDIEFETPTLPDPSQDRRPTSP
jgi:energy-coupling factor transporter ATP-binding protein EcfA2